MGPRPRHRRDAVRPVYRRRTAYSITELLDSAEAAAHGTIRSLVETRWSLTVWVDGIHFNIWLEDDRLCYPGWGAGGRDEGAGGTRGRLPGERGERWASVLQDLRGRGMRSPAVATGDGALGFWAAVRDV